MATCRSTASMWRWRFTLQGRWAKVIGRSAPTSTNVLTKNKLRRSVQSSPALLAGQWRLSRHRFPRPRGEEGADYLSGCWQEASGWKPEHLAHVGRSAANHASERGEGGEFRPPDQPRQAGVRRRRTGEHVQRSRDAMG